VNVALLPIGPGGLTVSEAAQLSADIQAKWVVPMHYGMFNEDLESDFVSHMLGHRPAQKFKVFQCGQKWTVPEE
jgi:L-ascorbate metabolism protein UlaG (beta-lactamase superfamily)